MKPWVIGNWKMNPDKQQAIDLIDSLSAQFKDNATVAQVGVCPPALWLDYATTKLTNNITAVGGQDLSALDNGAHTGDISASMLVSCGANMVIIGHSERRADHGESDELLAQKMQQASKHNLIPVLCVGESLAERKSKTHISVIQQQISNVIDACDKSVFQNAIIAYEPIWAIGTGLIPEDNDVKEMHLAIDALLTEKLQHSLAILYGGSVKPDNAKQLASLDKVSGFLVGGASLEVAGFMKIAQAFN